ncbi:DUF559 domain-containing protein [Tsukamurella sp. 8F]|uniref:endonuclease domain-containing protein n=1 Tax=unclassified Tsukamurella TaxID=2633480 RepID=UPI0023B9F43E|nr:MULTISPECIES: DUF559 domain-containing protein [unclassified Tsukamurella]MDF0529469.1 DUF559 domain-containing protein [Tsukamurella sp. 8J]MDF0585843.1 DUF559 domain-containing protein [Tsukamurella sp. 8F]
MYDVERLLRAGSGVVRARDLRAAGLDGRPEVYGLRRIRRGWYAGGSPPDDLIAAVAAGGALTCVSALRLRGVWVPEGYGVHARRTRYADARKGVVWCPVPHAPIRAACDPLPDALRAAARCRPPEDFIVLCDSVLNMRLATMDQLVEWLPGLPAAKSLARCDGRADSGTETMVRLRLRSEGIHLDIQVYLHGVGTVDILVGNRLIIECDSRAHHTDRNAYADDRRRDRMSTMGGYITLRLTYFDVVHDWEAVLDDIRTLIRRRAHR